MFKQGQLNNFMNTLGITSYMIASRAYSQHDLPPCILHWICAFYFTHSMRNAHFMGELLLYWAS